MATVEARPCPSLGLLPLSTTRDTLTVLSLSLQILVFLNTSLRNRMYDAVCTMLGIENELEHHEEEGSDQEPQI